MAGILFIDWRPHNRRAESLAEDLGATLELAPSRLRGKSIASLRYLFLAIRTMALLLRHRPDVVIASSPPPFCPVCAFAYALLFGREYVVDAHHLATTGFWSRVPLGFRFNRFVMNRALTTLVHNQEIVRMVREDGISVMTLETKIPELTGPRPAGDPAASFTVLIPCSFDPDEPIGEIWAAARVLTDVTFRLTGNHARLDPGLKGSAPPNLILSGFLSQAEYDGLLWSCDIVLATTTTDYPVRPRAAAEAVAAEKPVIASRNPATASHLGEAAVLIGNKAEEIVRAIGEIRSNYARFVAASAETKRVRQAQYETELERLKGVLRRATKVPAREGNPGAENQSASSNP
ncbi:MAG: glycosyltransferase [Gemmatimonadota bacterium]